MIGIRCNLKQRATGKRCFFSGSSAGGRSAQGNKRIGGRYSEYYSGNRIRKGEFGNVEMKSRNRSVKNRGFDLENFAVDMRFFETDALAGRCVNGVFVIMKSMQQLFRRNCQRENGKKEKR